MLNLQVDQMKLEEICRRYGVEFLGVFGSAARGENQLDSDVDVLVKFSPDSHTSLMGMVRMEAELEKMLGREVDLVTEGFLSKYFRGEVLRETRPLYGQT